MRHRAVRFAPAVLACAALFGLIVAGTKSSPASAPPAANAQRCEPPVAPGEIAEPRQIEAAALPVDDQGRHELVLRVVREGLRFCYHYTFDGADQADAPVLRVRRGETFAIRLVNELDGPAPGATMAASALAPCTPQMMPDVKPETFVGYMNHPAVARPMTMKDLDVNLHLHGFQGPERDENIFASTLSTPAHACEYAITIPQTQPPGTYFYHTHAHGMAEDEISGGLSGMWIVEPDSPQLPIADDHAIVMKYRIPYVATDNFVTNLVPLYIKAERDTMADKASPMPSFDPFDPPPWPSGIPVRGVGDVRMVRCGSRSGAATTIDHTQTPGVLTVPANQPQLLRILNATGDSITYLQMRDASGAPAPMQVVGRDGTPVGGDNAQPLSQYVAMGETTLPPAGRADVLLTLAPNQTVTFYNGLACQGPGDEVDVKQDLLTVKAGSPAPAPVAVASRPLEPEQSPAARLIAYARAHPDLVRRRAFTYTEYLVPSGRSLDGAYFITQTSAPHYGERSYWPVFTKHSRVPMPSVVVKRGTVEEWDLFNATVESHTFHIHQMSFVVENPPAGPATLDTVLVPIGKILPNPKSRDYPLIAPSRTRLLLDFRNVRRGTFVFHCHMMFHEDRGMMGVIKVV